MIKNYHGDNKIISGTMNKKNHLLHPCLVPEPGPLAGTPARWKLQSNSCAQGSPASSIESEGVALTGLRGFGIQESRVLRGPSVD